VTTDVTVTVSVHFVGSKPWLLLCNRIENREGTPLTMERCRPFRNEEYCYDGRGTGRTLGRLLAELHATEKRRVTFERPSVPGSRRSNSRIVIDGDACSPLARPTSARMPATLSHGDHTSVPCRLEHLASRQETSEMGRRGEVPDGETNTRVS
jgi:hypothetical protein